MTKHQHTIVWIAHREAKLFNFGADDVEKEDADLPQRLC